MSAKQKIFDRFALNSGFHHFFIMLAVACVLVACAPAQSVKQKQEQKPAEAAIASAEPQATEAGMEILREGGNAFDAAVAVSAALAVVEPYSSGLGGGGFWLLHVAKDNRDVVVDGRERAPLAATRDMYLDAKGDVIPRASIDGPLAAGIPGEPAALAYIAKHYGRLPLAQSLQPAIRLAREGFEIDKHYQRLAGFRLGALSTNEAAADIFLDGYRVPALHTRIVQNDLAHTLGLIAKHGAAGFYHGEVAHKLVAAVRKHGGIWSLKDLADYSVIERKPLVTHYRDMKIISLMPPSSGGVAIAEMSLMLEQLDYQHLDKKHKLHALIEAMRRAYHDRAEYLGDSDYVNVPIKRLLSKKHIKALLKNYYPDRATPSSELKPIFKVRKKAADTTHFSIIDQYGNRVSATLTINYPFGACFVPAGTGVLLNDEMDDFSSRPGTPNVYGLVGAEANAIAPGKRMLSSMSPSFVETKNRIGVLGTPGGSRIITMVFRAMLAFDDGASAKQMVDLPRIHHQYLPDVVYYEPGALNATQISQLKSENYHLEQLTHTFGNMQVVIENKKTGALDAASDPRDEGEAKIFSVAH